MLSATANNSAQTLTDLGEAMKYAAPVADAFAKTWERIKGSAQKAWNWIKSLFDDSVNLSAENRYVESRKRAAISRIEDDQRRKLAQRESRRQTARNRAAATHRDTLSRLGQENLDARRNLDAGFERTMARNEQQLAQARSEWKDALTEAQAKRKAAEGGGKDEDLDAGLKDAKKVLEGLGDVGALVRDQATKIGVQGTFNAAAARALEAGDAADRTAQATEETARNTKKLVKAATSGGLTFA